MIRTNFFIYYKLFSVLNINWTHVRIVEELQYTMMGARLIIIIYIA